MTSTARRAARSVQSSTGFRVAARAGYAANGVLHVLIGGFVIAVAFGGGGETDQSGAFRAVAEAPMGAALLWLIAAALVALGLWHVVEAFLARGSGGSARAGRIVSETAQALAFLAIGGVAASVALGARPNGEESAQQTSSGVLGMPGGPFLLGAAGLVVGGVGIAFVVMGVARSFRKKIRVPSGVAGTALVALGAVGFVAQGVALAVVGVLLVTAAITLDAQTAGGLDGAVRALLAAPGGVFLGVAVGVGFVAYGVFTALRARFARLES